MHAVRTGPIDYWDGWEPYEPGAPPEKFVRPDELSGEDGRYVHDLLGRMHEFAIRRFPALGWEGDGRWWYAGFPDEDVGPSFLLAVKQSNNGEVFIASPVPLRHLQNY